MTYHPGFLLAKHSPTDATWYKTEAAECNLNFPKSLERGDYIQCGGSGGLLCTHIHTTTHYVQYGYRTCGFIFGRSCCDQKLRRKWSCCGKGVSTTMSEMYKLPGCMSFARGFYLANTCLEESV
jgi:hypothetical protein